MSKTHPVIRLFWACGVGCLLAILPGLPTWALGTFLVLFIFHIIEG